MSTYKIRNVAVFDGIDLREGVYDIITDGQFIQKIIPSNASHSHTHGDEVEIEGSGFTALPGLMDLHVHLTWNGGKDPAEDIRRETAEEHMLTTVGSALKYLHAGITSVRDLGSPEDAALWVGNAIRDGKFLGPRIFASGQSIIMTGGHDPFHGIMVDGPWEALKAVRTQVAKGASVIKISATGGVYGRVEGESVDDIELRQDEVNIIIDEAHRRNVKVTAHAIGEQGIKGCLDAHIDCIEHGHCITEAMALDMKAKDISFVPTYYIYQHLSAHDDVPEYARKKAAEIIARHKEALKFCYEAGVRIGAGSDAGSPHAPHPSLMKELYALASGPLSNIDVLTAATSHAAEIIGVSHKLGFLREGYLADIVLVNGNPVKDLSCLENPVAVIKDGELIFNNDKNNLAVI